MIGPIGAALATIVLVVAVMCPGRYLGKGRHVSRPLGRRLGWSVRKVHFAQIGVLLVQVALVYSGLEVPCLVGQVVYIVWVVDDWLTGDDDEPRRKHEWAKVKIRMPKPVKIRPVERTPVPA